MLDNLFNSVSTGRLLSFAFILYGKQGSGRSMFGEWLRILANGDTRVEKQAFNSGFNLSWFGTTLRIADDVLNYQDGWNYNESMKPMVTEKRVTYMGKGTNSFVGDNHGALVILTNVLNLLDKDGDDNRRFQFVHWDTDNQLFFFNILNKELKHEMTRKKFATYIYRKYANQELHFISSDNFKRLNIKSRQNALLENPTDVVINFTEAIENNRISYKKEYIDDIPYLNVNLSSIEDWWKRNHNRDRIMLGSKNIIKSLAILRPEIKRGIWELIDAQGKLTKVNTRHLQIPFDIFDEFFEKQFGERFRTEDVDFTKVAQDTAKELQGA